MTFPQDALRLRAEIALGADITGDPALWSWTDISDYVRTADGARVVVRRGRRNDSGSVAPATASFDLDNTGGRFCTQNPTSPHYPNLKVNTPVKISVSTDSGATWSVRYSGYLTRLPSSWRGAAGNDSWVSVTAESVLRRLGKQGAHSPLYWTAPNLPSSNAGCIEYWPMEDGKEATECSSFFPDGIAMTTTGSIELGASSPPAGSAATPQSDYEFMKANPPSATGIVRPYADTGEWNVLGIFKVESDAAWSTTLMDCDINKSEGSTQPDRIRLVVTDTKLVLHVYQEDDTLLGTLDTGTITTKPPGDGEWHAVAVRAAQSGSDVLFRIRYEGVTYTLTLTSKTLGTIRKVSFPAPTINTAPDVLAVGHLAVYDDDLAVTYLDRYANAMKAYYTGSGEAANTRLTRLDDESGLMHSIFASSTETAMYERLGEQPHANVLGVINDTVETDGGILFEPKDFASGSLRYRARSLINANVLGTPALTLTQDDFSIIEQGDDDHYLVTQATVSGAGSSATASASAVENEVSVSRNIRHPERLPDHAGWVLYQGTRDDYRYPRIQILLHGATSKIAAWKTLELGDRVLITDPPPGVVNDIDLLLEGYQESMDQYSWTAELYCSPASRYRIAKLDDTTYGRMDTAGSRLVNAVSSSATTLEVETYEGAEWSTTASGFDLGIGGERMTVAAIANAFSDTFTRSVASGWGTSTSGHAWSTSGGSSSDYSVNGSRGLISLGVVGSLRSTFVAGLASADFDRTFTVRVPVLATGSGIQVRSAARWDTVSGDMYMVQIQIETTNAVTATIRKVVGGVTTTLRTRTLSMTHTTTTDYRVRLKIEGPWIYSKIWVGAEPTQWTDFAYDTSITAVGVWGIRCGLNSGNTNALPVVVQFDDDATINPQRFTVTRAVNGVAKTHAAGAAVNLFIQNHLGL